MRKIIHVDMDAFYASIEQRDFPEYKGKPVIVGGSPKSRGVVATASYEARKFGVRSAMSSAMAYRLCPEGIFVFPRFHVYKQVSEEIQEIFYNYSDLVEPLSLDEAYLDVTENKVNNPYATLIAKEIKEKIKQKTNLTASAGVGINKFVAKVASGMNKPDGLTVIKPEDTIGFIENLEIGQFFGVGKVTEKKMRSLGIHTGKDLKQKSKSELVQNFGKAGSYYFYIVRGEDNRKVNPSRERKSVGVEHTFSKDLTTVREAQESLKKTASELLRRMEKSNSFGKTLTLKVKYDNFEQITRSLTIQNNLKKLSEISEITNKLLEDTEVGKRKVRLLGLSISNIHEKEKPDDDQPRLFENI